MRQSGKLLRLKQSNEDQCSVNTSVLRYLITTFPITLALAVSQAEFLMDVFLTVSFPFPLRTHSHFANCARCPWPDTDDLLRCSQKCYASVHQIQSLIPQKAYASKLKRSDYIHVLQPKAHHKGSKILFTVYGILMARPVYQRKVLQSNKYQVRKNDTNKTQVLHHMWMRQFTSRQPSPDIRITPRKRTSDPEVSPKHDSL